jgi:hypothetical protein
MKKKLDVPPRHEAVPISTCIVIMSSLVVFAIVATIPMWRGEPLTAGHVTVAGFAAVFCWGFVAIVCGVPFGLKYKRDGDDDEIDIHTGK